MTLFSNSLDLPRLYEVSEPGHSADGSVVAFPRCQELRLGYMSGTVLSWAKNLLSLFLLNSPVAYRRLFLLFCFDARGF